MRNGRLSKYGLVIIHCFLLNFYASAQFPDSARTGYLLDASEEYWLAPTASIKGTGFIESIKHIPINKRKGFVSIGINIREGYEHFGNYLWGIGPQDKNGYFLHRVLFHNDLRWNRHFRSFLEVQSSTISDRNGGPRPVQDLNKIAINQFFGELTLHAGKWAMLHFRFGKQSLNYGTGTLLDIRDANVRRSFAGSKIILENKSLKVDAFFMLPIAVREGIFDDQIDHSQKVGGFWGTRKFHNNALTKLDLYYVFINRRQTRFNQGTGKEVRNTVGMAATCKKGNWFSYCEADVQFGKFNNGNIRAWKIAPSFGYQVQMLRIKPVFTIQGAISSGDKDSSDPVLQTFNPLYPKAIYYGFIDNAGSANLIVIHPKVEFQFFKRLTITAGYYQFWKQQLHDGIYAVNGSYLLPPANEKRPVGSMWDILTTCTLGNHVIIQLIGSCYKMGEYLKQQPALNGDIRYAGIKSTLRI
jgi:hypothetical protein